MSARFVRAGSACVRSTPRVPPTTVGRGCLRLVETEWPRHYRRSIGFVIRYGLHASTFLRPLAPRALPRFPAVMDALTPAGRLFGPRGHEHRSVSRRVSLLLSCSLPTVPSPTTLPPPSRHFLSFTVSSALEGSSVDPVSVGSPRESFPRGFGAGLRTAVAGSPVGLAESGSRCAPCFMSPGYGPVVHLRQLPTPCCHDAVAFGYRRVNVPPDRDSHPAMGTPSQAHDRNRSAVAAGPSATVPRRMS